MMLGGLATLVTWLMGLFLKKSGPQIQDIAASNATAQTELSEQESANATLVKASTASSDADTRIMREQSSNTLDVDPAGHWRD